jgi:hypothetical protein
MEDPCRILSKAFIDPENETHPVSHFLATLKESRRRTENGVQALSHQLCATDAVLPGVGVGLPQQIHFNGEGNCLGPLADLRASHLAFVFEPPPRSPLAGVQGPGTGKRLLGSLGFYLLKDSFFFGVGQSDELVDNGFLLLVHGKSNQPRLRRVVSGIAWITNAVPSLSKT